MKAVLSAALFAAAAHAEPVTNLFEIQTYAAALTAFREVGDDNLGTSLREESGTLAMLSAHFTDAPNRHLVFEVYRDEAAYQAHTASPQYRRFVEVAKTAVAAREKIAVRPEFLGENTALADLGGSDKFIQYQMINVKPAQREAFADLSRRTFAAALEAESGLLALYAVSLQDAPQQWRILRIYRDESAYNRHHAAPAWQEYQRQSATLIAAQTAVRLQGNTLTGKGNLLFPNPKQE